MKRVVVSGVAFVLFLSLIVIWMAGGIQRPRTIEPLPYRVDVTARTSTRAPEVLTVVTWNIAWGYGFGSEGTGKAKPKSHFEESVPRIGDALFDLGADIAILQEVDFGSDRSHLVDQAQIIAAHARLPYIAPAESWRANYLPFPYWPPREHFARMSSGGAVLSRFPILTNQVELLEKPRELPFWYEMFYLFRYFQRTELDLGGRTLAVFHTHLEAFDEDNRVAQARHLLERLNQESTPLTLFGGDLNTVPPESPIKTGYSDEPETNHEHDETATILRKIKNLSDVVTPDRFRSDPSSYFTFPAHGPNRKLDYLFVGTGIEVVEARVAREVGDVSDHLPIVATIKINTDAN